MKGSIVSRQIDRSVYYNVLPHVTHRVHQQMRVDRYLLKHPVNFSDTSRTKGHGGESVRWRGIALSIAFLRFPAGDWNPHHELFRILTSTLLNFFLLLKNEPPPSAFFHVRLSVRLILARSSNASVLPLVVPSVFPLGRRPMVPPSRANFYFPASGVLKITLRPCLRSPRPPMSPGGGGLYLVGVRRYGWRVDFPYRDILV